MTKPDEVYSSHALLQGLIALSCLALGVALGWAVLALPTSSSALAETVQADLVHSGVANPVTAVLLNFRSYDTLLEIGVLVLAVLCVWSLPRSHTPFPRRDEMAPGLVLRVLVCLLVPFMVMVAGYLLWLGAHAPGGAFQGGAVLGAVWVLLVLTGRRPLSRLHGWPLRTVLVLGFVVFLAVAVGVMAAGGHLLQYPRHWAKDLILLIEAALTLSIAFILVALFVGSPRQEPSEAKQR